MTDITISKLLAGCTPGRMQSVGYMQIVPLLSNIVDNDIVSPIGVVEASTSNYGTLNVTNKSKSYTIFPSGGAVISKQSVQNHASPKGIFIKPNVKVTTNQAACIQENQGGAMRPETTFHMSILPWAMREYALDKKDSSEYNKIWPAIREFNQHLGLMNKGHLEFFLDSFKDQLDTFIAEFEIVPNMVGAIIFLDGDIIGIERSPNYEYWKSMWEPLIRESYGSEALRYAKLKKSPPPKMRIPLASARIKSVKDILPELQKVQRQEEARVKKIIKSFIKTKFVRTVEQRGDSISMETIKNRQFIGQVLCREGGFPYVSLVTTNKWQQNPNAADWSEAADFTM